MQKSTLCFCHPFDTNLFFFSLHFKSSCSNMFPTSSFSFNISSLFPIPSFSYNCLNVSVFSLIISSLLLKVCLLHLLRPELQNCNLFCTLVTEFELSVSFFHYVSIILPQSSFNAQLNSYLNFLLCSKTSFAPNSNIIEEAYS